jgi:nucleoside-diphosphate-sugar epimerase
MLIGVTGASGYVGKAVCLDLLNRGFKVRAFLRTSSRPNLPSLDRLECFFISNFLERKAWRSGLKGINILIHCAAKTSEGNSNDRGEELEFQSANVHVTELIGSEASACGVQRLIFLSSIKVHGECNQHNQPFRAIDSPQPVSLYAKTKWEAEKSLLGLCNHSSMELGIIRSPAVYGPNIGGNIGKLVRLCDTAIPLPLANFASKRSFISIDNLVSFIFTCVSKPLPRKIWLISDNKDLSTAEFISKIRQGFERPVRLFIIPKQVWRVSGYIAKNFNQIKRLNAPLQADITTSVDCLDWSPVISTDTAIEQMLSVYRK